ncbi:MAG: glycosyltransferase, partial [Haloplanus sp.]
MRFQPVDGSLSRRELFAVAGVLVGMFAVLAYLLPEGLFLVVLAISSMATVYYTMSILITRNSHRLPEWARTVPIWLTFLLPFTVTTVLAMRYWAFISPVMVALVVALLTIFFYYWFVVPLALYQKIDEQSRSVSITDWPEISVLVPAYNEEGYVGPCIDALLAADYPPDKLDIVVVDDGSVDGTYAEARRHATDAVTVVHKENGGKHSALNYGLRYATAEFVVTIDADSIVAGGALRELVRTFEARPDADAVAGNVKVSNRGPLVTNLQALEYVIGINTFRRAFDLLGVVTVVPGCLGAFRRDALELVDGYDADTLTEDFDATIQLLKEGKRIHHSSAVVYTEAPDTWRDLYRQRLRWFRGNLQTVIKHRRAVIDGEFGLLHRVAFPYVLFSMSVLPFLGIVILGIVVWSLVRGAYWQVFGMFVFFTVLQLLLSTLAIRIDTDDLWLARYAPFSIIGYKQFLDAVLIKSFVDVLYKSDFSWTRARRRRQRDEFSEDAAT